MISTSAGAAPGPTRARRGRPRTPHGRASALAERRAVQPARRFQERLRARLAGRLDGASRRRRGPRPALDGRLRQRRVAELDVTSSSGRPEGVGRDLRQDRVGAGADVGRRAGDLEPAVPRQRRARPPSSACMASQTPLAMPQPTSSRPSRIERGVGIAVRPAEALGALRVAGAKLLAGEGLVLVLVLVA